MFLGFFNLPIICSFSCFLHSWVTHYLLMWMELSLYVRRGNIVCIKFFWVSQKGEKDYLYVWNCSVNSLTHDDVKATILSFWVKTICSTGTLDWIRVRCPICVALETNTNTSVMSIFSNYYWCLCLCQFCVWYLCQCRAS